MESGPLLSMLCILSVDFDNRVFLRLYTFMNTVPVMLCEIHLESWHRGRGR